MVANVSFVGTNGHTRRVEMLIGKILTSSLNDEN